MCAKSFQSENGLKRHKQVNHQQHHTHICAQAVVNKFGGDVQDVISCQGTPFWYQGVILWKMQKDIFSRLHEAAA